MGTVIRFLTTATLVLGSAACTVASSDETASDEVELVGTSLADVAKTEAELRGARCDEAEAIAEALRERTLEDDQRYFLFATMIVESNCDPKAAAAATVAGGFTAADFGAGLEVPSACKTKFGCSFGVGQLKKVAALDVGDECDWSQVLLGDVAEQVDCSVRYHAKRCGYDATCYNGGGTSDYAKRVEKLKKAIARGMRPARPWQEGGECCAADQDGRAQRFLNDVWGCNVDGRIITGGGVVAGPC